MVFRDNPSRGFGLQQPGFDRGQVLDFGGLQDGFHNGAVGMPADDQVLDAEDGHCVLDRGRAPSHNRSV